MLFATVKQPQTFTSTTKFWSNVKLAATDVPPKFEQNLSYSKRHRQT